MFPSFEDFLAREQRTIYVKNPKKLINYDRCAAIAEMLRTEHEVDIQAVPVQGGVNFVLRLFTGPYPQDFNFLLGELIARSDQFCPCPDLEDSCYTFISAIVYTCDRILDGRVMPDL